MEFKDYKENIKDRLSRYFNIEEKYTYSNKEFDLFAVSNVRNEKYMASKKLTIYAFENDQYCFMKHFKELSKDDLEEIIKILKDSIMDYVDPHHEHMSSTITGILVVDELKEDNLIKSIQKFKYQKSFAFGLKGWADVGLILVDLKKGEVFTSQKAKKVDKFYRP
ncbi:hypothetical protein R9X47_10615 [Wukongibacter baidiensis]|uniref:hypothetical protein n=1 Tax=Wukongibacter baidiensis TaxID=1723361 RepID=UPI003D7F9C45